MTTLLVPHAGRSASDVRHALQRELRECGLSDDVVDDAVLVVSELVGNAVRHGAPLDGGTVRASWWVGPAAVHVEVCDGGPGPPGGAGEVHLGARARRTDAVGAPLDTVPIETEGGRGLPIVNLLSARWGTTVPSPSGAVSVYAELPIVVPPPAPRAATD